MYRFITETDPLLQGLTLESLPAMIDAAQERLLPVLASARFAVDAEGVPVSEDVRDRLRRACAAQLHAWHRWRIDPNNAGQASARVKSTSQLGPGSVSYDFRDNYATALARARDEIDPTALAWLRPLLTQPAY